MIRAVQSLLLVSASLLSSPLCSNDYDSPGCLAVAKATSHVNRVLYIFFFFYISSGSDDLQSGYYGRHHGRYINYTGGSRMVVWEEIAGFLLTLSPLKFSGFLNRLLPYLLFSNPFSQFLFPRIGDI
jgi:hypothetical protein